MLLPAVGLKVASPEFYRLEMWMFQVLCYFSQKSTVIDRPTYICRSLCASAVIAEVGELVIEGLLRSVAVQLSCKPWAIKEAHECRLLFLQGNQQPTSRRAG